MLNLNYPFQLLCLYLTMHMNVTDQHICTTEFIFNPKLHPPGYKTKPEIINLYLDGHMSNAIGESCVIDLGLLHSRISEIQYHVGTLQA